MSDTIYPLPAFYFTLRVLDKREIEITRADIDASFQEISGIEAEMDTETVAEGGENRFVHRLPKAPRYRNLVLKRGVTTQHSFLVEWVSKSLLSGLTAIQTHDVLVMLLNESGAPAMTWIFSDAYPVKYSVSPMNSQEDKLLIETLELAYSHFTQIVTAAEQGNPQGH